MCLYTPTLQHPHTDPRVGAVIRKFGEAAVAGGGTRRALDKVDDVGAEGDEVIPHETGAHRHLSAHYRNPVRGSSLSGETREPVNNVVAKGMPFEFKGESP